MADPDVTTTSDEKPAPEPPRAPVDDVVDETESSAPRVESRTEVKAIVEALLFTTNSSMSAKRLAGMLSGWTPKQIEEIILELRDELDDQGHGVMLQEVAGGWLMCTRPRFAEWVFSLHRSKRRNPLTPQALETLAIIAYKQPITRADIEVIRGVDAGGMLRNLLDLDLVAIIGHRESAGRPPLYGTTDIFLRTFGLKSVNDLPSIDELRALVPPAAEEPENPDQTTLPLDGEDAADEEELEDDEDEEEFEDGDEVAIEDDSEDDDSDEEEFSEDEDEDEDEDEERG